MPRNFFLYWSKRTDQGFGSNASQLHLPPFPTATLWTESFHAALQSVTSSLGAWKGRQAQAGLPGTCSCRGIIFRGVFHSYILQGFVKTTKFNGNFLVARFKALGLKGQMCRGLLDLDLHILFPATIINSMNILHLYMASEGVQLCLGLQPGMQSEFKLCRWVLSSSLGEF